MINSFILNEVESRHYNLLSREGNHAREFALLGAVKGDSGMVPILEMLDKFLGDIPYDQQYQKREKSRVVKNLIFPESSKAFPDWKLIYMYQEVPMFVIDIFKFYLGAFRVFTMHKEGEPLPAYLRLHTQEQYEAWEASEFFNKLDDRIVVTMDKTAFPTGTQNFEKSKYGWKLGDTPFPVLLTPISYDVEKGNLKVVPLSPINEIILKSQFNIPLKDIVQLAQEGKATIYSSINNPVTHALAEALVTAKLTQEIENARD